MRSARKLAARGARTDGGLRRSLRNSRGTAKIRPKCAIAALRTGKRTHDRRLLRMPFSEGSLVICCGECESRHCAARRIRFRGQDSVLRRLPRAQESPGTSLDEHNVPFCGLRRALTVAGARPIAGFGRILAVPAVAARGRARRSHRRGRAVAGRAVDDHQLYVSLVSPEEGRVRRVGLLAGHVNGTFASGHPVRVRDRGEAKRRCTQVIRIAGALQAPARVAKRPAAAR